jgi:hypothetical protein
MILLLTLHSSMLASTNFQASVCAFSSSFGIHAPRFPIPLALSSGTTHTNRCSQLVVFHPPKQRRHYSFLLNTGYESHRRLKSQVDDASNILANRSYGDREIVFETGQRIQGLDIEEKNSASLVYNSSKVGFGNGSSLVDKLEDEEEESGLIKEFQRLQNSRGVVGKGLRKSLVRQVNAASASKRRFLCIHAPT